MRSLVLMVVAGSALAAEPLVPVVVAAVDIKAGTVVTVEMISQRGAEPALVTSSIVKPASASYVVNQKARFPILAGDVLLWTFFEAKTGDALQTKCAAAVQSPENAEDQVAQHRAVVKRARK